MMGGGADTAMADLIFRVAELERQIKNIVRPAVVSEVDAAEARARVEFGKDADGEPVLSGWLPWLAPAAGGRRVWRAPSVGEQVLVFAPGGELFPAAILPGIFYDDFPAPESSIEREVTIWPDGSSAAFDGAGPTLSIQAAEGTAVEIAAPDGLDITGDVRMTGDLAVTGGIIASEDVEASGDLLAAGNVEDSRGTMQEMRGKYNSHSHTPTASTPPAPAQRMT